MLNGVLNRPNSIRSSFEFASGRRTEEFFRMLEEIKDLVVVYLETLE
jgi:hypothetical protein